MIHKSYKSVKIILLSILLAIGYGIVHDLITANICVEYFTVGHPKIIESNSPFLLALVWGVIATWWVGLTMGVFIAIANGIGKMPQLALKAIISLIAKLMLVMLGVALIAGVIGYTLTELEIIRLVPKLTEQMDEGQYSNFLAAGWAHSASYITGIIGTIFICRIIYKKRKVDSHRETTISDNG